MDMPQRKPQSLIDFQRRNEEVMLFEDFKTTEHDVHPGFQEETQFDAQRVEFRATKHRYVCLINGTCVHTYMY